MRSDVVSAALGPVRDDTPLSSFVKDRADWLALAYLLNEHGYVLSDSDVASCHTVADLRPILRATEAR